MPDPLIHSLIGTTLEMGGRAFIVRPPSVRTGLVVSAALEASDGALLAEGCRGWLPPALHSVLFSAAVAPSERERVLRTLLVADLPGEALRAAQKAAEEQAADASWSEVLSAYRQAYAPADVLAEPWGVFLLQLRELGRVHAGEMLRNVRWYVAAKTGGEALDQIVQQAGWKAPALPPAPEHLRGERGRDYVSRKVAEFQTKMARGQRPEARA